MRNYTVKINYKLFESEPDILRTELDNAIKKLKRNKISGPDRIDPYRH